MSAVEIFVEAEGGTPVVTFAGVPTPADLQRCRQTLLAALGGARCISLKLDAVEMADLAFVQILCAAHRTAAAGGGGISLAGAVPRTLVELLERAGLERCTGGPAGCVIRRLLAARGPAA